LFVAGYNPNFHQLKNDKQYPCNEILFSQERGKTISLCILRNLETLYFVEEKGFWGG
jgi:hypothetical protein